MESVVISLAHPGGNVTGIGDLAVRLYPGAVNSRSRRAASNS